MKQEQYVTLMSLSHWGIFMSQWVKNTVTIETNDSVLQGSREHILFVRPAESKDMDYA